MLAGIVISVVVLAGLAVAVPWLVSQRDAPDLVDSDISERFSDSMRIVRGDVLAYAEHDGVEISTPLIRRAELTELRLLARSAAARRARTAAILVVLIGVTAGVAALGYIPWWSLAIPGALLVAFMIASPTMVRAMNRRFDARARAVMEGYVEDEMTEVLHLGLVDEESVSIDVDLSAPEATGSLWDPIPVTAATYVSKPLAPRTVRTIDLSSPVSAPEPVVPTADHPAEDVEAIELEETEVVQRPRAVGE